MKRSLSITLFVATFLFPVEALAQCSGAGGIVTAVADRLENLRDFTADFVQREHDGLNQTLVEEGHVWVERPNKARWEYRFPEEKLFVTDGSDVYSYVPADRQVRHGEFDETVDDRLPIMFLMGRADLETEFERIRLLAADPVVPGACVLDMVPVRSDDFESVLIEVDSASYDIVRLVLSSIDGYRSEFVFRNLIRNEGVDDELFRFAPPSGVRLVEGL